MVSTRFCVVCILCFTIVPTSPAQAATSPFARAKWIAPAGKTDPLTALPLFHKEFNARSRPARATLRIVGLGDYDARINGRRISETGINQPWSQYEKTLYYREFEVSRFLHAGPNALGVMLANSFWHNPNPPKGRYNKDGPQREAAEPFLLMAELHMFYEDGSSSRVGTDETWRTETGPIVFSHVFGGEDYDARKEQFGWDRPGFATREWQRARVVVAPTSRLVRQNWPAFAEDQVFVPDQVQRCADDVYLYTFPQNCSAQLRVEIEGGKPADRINFRCGEHKHAQERLFGNYIVGCDLITTGERLVHQWVSFYLGMQFVEVQGAVPRGHPNPRNLPVIRSLQLVQVRTGLPEVSVFASSSKLFNRTHDLVDWAMKANTSHVLSDCPHREKLGWLECAYLLAPSFQYRYECRNWFEKIMQDIRDAQEPRGRVPTVAPPYPAGRFPSAFSWTVEWGAASVLLPWQQYLWTGDKGVLERNLEMMCRFTDCLESEAKDGLAPGGLGDWYDYGHGQPPGPSRFTPTQLSSTATWGLCANTVAKAAQLVGRHDLTERYKGIHHRVAASFQRHFQDSVSRKLKHLGSPQCANAMAICAEVVPQSDYPILIQDTIEDLRKRDWQQTAGDIGHVYFIRALAEAGRSDVLHRVYSRDGLGSYGGILKKGLTSMPETWDAMMDGYQSLNHCMLGHVLEWYYGYVAGIRQEPGTAGWQRIVIGPNPGGLSDCHASVRTPAGLVVSDWEFRRGTFRLDATIPPGIRATAILPSGERRTLRAGRQRVTLKVLTNAK